MKIGPFRIGRVKKKQSKPTEQAQATRQEVPREKVPGKIGFEIVREKDQRSITVKRGKLKPKQEWVQFKSQDGVRRRFYANHIIKETASKKDRYFVRWNLYSSEAYDADGNIKYDSNLENSLMDDMEMQLGKAVGAAVGFVFERPMIIILLLAMVFGIPIGLSYNDIFNWVPRTVVHWVPRT